MSFVGSKNKVPPWLLCLWLGALSADVAGHGLPIYVSVDSSTNQVKPSAGFDSGVFQVHPVFGLSSDLPGLGVLEVSEQDGVDSGDQIGLRVTQGLLYWDGSKLSPTAATLTINSAETQQTYHVAAQSGLQSGMVWATYPAEPYPFWDADGLFQLSGGSQGIYGLVVQVLLDKPAPYPDPIASEPLVIPFVYGNWAGQEATAVELLKEAVILPLDADFNRDWKVDEEDLSLWRAHYGLSQSAAVVQGNADGDNDVDGADFLLWQRAHQGEFPQAGAVSALPEPASWLLCMVATGSLFLLRLRKREQEQLESSLGRQNHPHYYCHHP
ncbi:MAG: hypothetical protein MI725_00265 [Pirellulales bacterium]|nr:hypothetical protein [Pirellulales bacterium]